MGKGCKVEHLEDLKGCRNGSETRLGLGVAVEEISVDYIDAQCTWPMLSQPQSTYLIPHHLPRLISPSVYQCLCIITNLTKAMRKSGC
jgi:hypothetical protein